MTLARPSDGERAPPPGGTRAAAAKVGLGATPELLGEEPGGGGDVPSGALRVAGHGQGLDEQLVVGLVQRLELDEAAGGAGRLVQAPVGHPAEGGLAQVTGGHGVGADPLGREPRVEPAAGLDVDAGQQRLAQPWEGQGLDPRAVGQDIDVDHDLRCPPQLQRIASQLGGPAQRPAQLGEGPPQRTERVVGPVEEHRRDPLAGDRPVAQRQQGEQRPALLAAHGHPVAIRRDLRAAQQADRGRHGGVLDFVRAWSPLAGARPTAHTRRHTRPCDGTSMDEDAALLHRVADEATSYLGSVGTRPVGLPAITAANDRPSPTASPSACPTGRSARRRSSTSCSPPSTAGLWPPAPLATSAS